MDRLIYTALNALSVARDGRVAQANNLANLNVPGFRRDLDNGTVTRFADLAHTLPTRAFRTETLEARFSNDQGPLSRTDNDLDVAIDGAGFFLVAPEGGAPALSRRGDLSVDQDGILRNGAGDVMLDIASAPIVLPPHSSVRITDMGEIFVEPAGGGPAAAVGMLATITPPDDLVLVKSLDGRIRPAQGALPAPDQMAQIRQGVLEGANVNAVEEMLSTIEAQRDFEIGMRMIQNAAQLDEAGARLMAAPQG